jgi:hypothetical protein
MATTDDTAAQLNRTLISLTSGIANADPKLRNAFEKIVASQDALADSYADTLKNSKAYTKQEVSDAKIRIDRLKKVAETESELHKQYAAAFKKYQDQVKTLQGDDLKQAGDNYTASYNLHKEGLKKIKESSTEREALERKVSARWSDTVRDTWKEQKDKLLSTSTLKNSVAEGYSALVESAATQMGEDLTTSFHTAMLGFKPTDFIKFQAEFRRTELAMVGGQDAFIKGMDVGQKAYSTMLLKPGEASKTVAEQFQILTNSGIRPAANDASMFADTLTRVSAMTGKHASEINADLASIAEDESTQTLLKMATTDEARRSIIQGTQAQYANSIALGMSSKQAIASAVALNKLQTQTAKSRITEAARIRVLGSALGMGAEGAELAGIRTKGAGASPAELQRATEISAAISQKLTQMRGGRIEGALNVESLSEGLKLDQQFGPDSPFNTTLANAVSPQATDMHTASEGITALAQTGEKIYAAIVNSPLLTGGLSVGNLLLTEIAWNTSPAGGGILGKMKGIFSGGAAEGAAGLGGKLLRGAGGGIGGLLGGFALDAAGGYEERQGNKKTAAALGVGSYAASGAGMGAMLGSIVPGLGNLVGAGIGGAAGAGYGLYKNWGKLTGAGSTASPTATDEQAANEATVKTNESITEQLKKMDTSNDFLKTISENSSTSAEYMEKLLYVAMMSDKDKQAAATRLSLLKDNRFGSQYGYTM